MFSGIVDGIGASRFQGLEMKMVNDPNCPATRALTPTDIRQKLMRRLALYGRVREIESRQKTVEA